MRYKIDASGMGRKDGRPDGWIDKLSPCFSSPFYLKNRPGLLSLGDRSVKFHGLQVCQLPLIYRVEQKNIAKFSDTCSVRADGLCIGSPRLVGGRKAGNSNMQEFFAPRCTL